MRFPCLTQIVLGCVCLAAMAPCVAIANELAVPHELATAREQRALRRFYLQHATLHLTKYALSMHRKMKWNYALMDRATRQFKLEGDGGLFLPDRTDSFVSLLRSNLASLPGPKDHRAWRDLLTGTQGADQPFSTNCWHAANMYLLRIGAKEPKELIELVEYASETASNVMRQVRAAYAHSQIPKELLEQTGAHFCLASRCVFLGLHRSVGLENTRPQRH